MAKRVNTRFLIVVGSVLFFGMCLIVVGPRIRNRLLHSREQLVKEDRETAQKAVAEGRYADAETALEDARHTDNTSREVAVELGDVLMLMAAEKGPIAAEGARQSWKDALTIDPSYKPALQRLLDSYIEAMDVRPSVPTCEGLHEAAEQSLRADPSDARAAMYLPIAVVEEWVLGGTKVGVPDAMNKLADICKKDPSASDALFYLIRGKGNTAKETLNTKPEAATAIINECRGMLEVAATAYPKSAPMQFRVFQGYQAILAFDRDTAQSAKDREAASAALSRLLQNAAADDPRQADFQYIAADVARRDGKVDEAEKILRAYYNSHQDDQRARLALVRLIGGLGDRAKREEAIALLKLPIGHGGAKGVRAPGFNEMEAQTLLELASLRITDYANTPADKRPEVLKAIDDTFSRLRDVVPVTDSIPILRLKGMIQELKGQNVDAVESLQRALALLESSDPTNPMRYELMYQLASADRVAGQNRAAEKLLSPLAEKFDGYLPAHEQLAELYLQENNLDGAAKQIQILTARMPDSPEVIRMQIALMQRANRPDDAKQFLAKLPEEKFEQKAIKAQSALNLKDYVEGARLLLSMHQDKPDDAAITNALAQVYFRDNQKDKARALVNEGLKVDPKNAQLQVLLKQLDGATPEETEQFIETVLTPNDKFGAEVQSGRQALAQGKFAQALDHARVADQIRPNDPATWDLYFQIYRRQRDWDKCDKAVANLTRLDADHATGRMYRWQEAMSRNNYADAITVARELTVTRDSFGQSWLLLAQAYQANGQYQEALKYYAAAMERQTTNLDVYKGTAECYLALGQPDRALEVVAAGRKVFPDNVALREVELRLLAASRPEDVVPVRRKLLSDDPTNPENYIALAAACLASGQKIIARDPAEAKKYIDEAHDVLGRGAEKFPDNVRLATALAEWLANANQYPEGLKVIQALSARPEWKGKTDILILLAEYNARSGHPQEAEHAYRDALAATDGKSIDIELQLAQYLSQQRKYDASLDVLKANADDQRVARQVLQTQIAASHIDDAIKGLNAQLAKEPDNTDLLNLLAVAYIDGKKLPEARKTLARVLEVDHGHNDTALYYQALAELRDPVGGDMELAIKNLRTLVTHQSKNVRYMLDLADALARVKDADGATAELEDAVRVDPGNRDARLRLLEALSARHKWTEFEQTIQYAEQNANEGIWARMHAYALSAQGHGNEAIAKINEAITLEPQNANYQRDDLILLLQNQAYDRAFATSDKLLNAGRKDWWIYQVRGAAFAASSKTPEAIAELDKGLAVADAAKDADGASQTIQTMSDVSLDEALQRLSSRQEPHFRLQSVSIQMRKQDFAGALGTLNALLTSSANLSRADRLAALRLTAECDQALNKSQEAKAAYEQFLVEAPNDPIALNNLAYLLAEDLKQPDEAYKYSKKIYDYGRKFNVVDPMIWDTHGWVLVKCGGDRLAEGTAVLNELVDHHPEFLEARYHLAQALILKDRTSDAISQLTFAMDQIKAMESKKQTVRPQLKADIQAALAKLQKSAAAN